VIVGENAINSCLFPAIEIEGKEILTIEGLASPDGTPHPLQKSFVEKGAIQCGFCTPGMILAAKALLDENPHPSDEEIKEALAGNLCRCTGYIQIIEAIRSASRYAEPSIHVVPWQTEEK
jgi:carbon-monoxide dehydrogenase small subunit